MTSINGIDPLLLYLVKTPTQQPAINKSQKSQIPEEKKDRDQRQRRSRLPSNQMRQCLETAVIKLNKLLQINRISLYARVVEHDEELKVQLADTYDHHIIAEIYPEKVFELVAEFNPHGFSVNKSI